MAPTDPTKRQLFAGDGHDHRGCVRSALAAAEAVCAGRGARLTALRRRVLGVVWSSHRPLGAYAILEELRKEGRAVPPTVYRALEFLQAHGLVHRIESLNAYVGCAQPGSPHAGQFLICGSCKASAELDDPQLAQAVETCAAAAGFRVETQTIEIKGICPHCQTEAENGPKP